MKPLDAMHFRNVLHKIPFAQDSWKDLITLMKESFDAHAGVMLITRDEDHDILISHSPDFQINEDVRCAFEQSRWITAATPEEWDDSYLSKGVVLGTDFVDQNEMRQTPFYRDVLSTLDLEYLMAGISMFGDGYRSLLKFFRSPKQENYTEREALQLAMLMPEIRQMMRFTERLYERMVVETAAYRSGAPQGAATLIVDRNGHVVHASDEAENILRDGTILTAKRDRLTAPQAGDDDALSRMIAAALGKDGPPTQDCALIGEDSPVGVHQMLALPTPTQEPPFPWMETLKVAAMVVIDPLRQVSVNPEILKKLYGLTPAEIELTNAMANGTKPTAYAAQIGKSAATVQSQRQAVFRKIGVANQLELMRILRDLIVSYEAKPVETATLTTVH